MEMTNMSNMSGMIKNDEERKYLRSLSHSSVMVKRGSVCLLKRQQLNNRAANTAVWGYNDIDDEQADQYKQSLLKYCGTYCGSRDILFCELWTCCSQNHVKRLAILANVFSEELSIDLDNEYLEDEDFHSPLILCISSGSIKCALLMIEKGQQAIISKYCRGLTYKGANAFHFAIMKGNRDIIINMLNKIGDPCKKQTLVTAYATGTMFKKMGLSGCPAILAIQCGYMDIYFDLIDNGAEMDLVDPVKGNTAVHTIVEYGRRDEETAHIFLDQYLNHESAKKWFCRKLKIDLDEYTKEDHFALKTYLLKIEDKDHYTPLVYAAKLKVYSILIYLLQIEGVYKFTEWEFGPTCYANYDMAEVDPAVAQLVRPGKPNVLEHLLFNGDDDVPALTATPLKQLMKKKWKGYTPLIFVWMVFHIIFITWKSYQVIKTFSDIPKGSTNQTVQTVLRAEASKHNSVAYHDLMIMMIINCIYALLFVGDIWKLLKLLIIGRIFLFCGKHYKVPWRIICQLNEYDVILACFSGCSIAWCATYWYSTQKHFLTLLCASLIYGWIFCLYFTRLVKGTCYFTVMIRRIFILDLMKFAVVMIVIILSFALAITLIFSVSPNPPPDVVSSVAESMTTLFQIMIGIGALDFIESAPSQYESEVTILVYTFILISLVLMMNLLIAAMSDTYITISVHRENLCQKLRAQTVLTVEGRIPSVCVKQFVLKRFMVFDEGKCTWMLPIKASMIKMKKSSKK